MILDPIYIYDKNDPDFTLDRLPKKFRDGIRDTGVVEATIGLVQYPDARNDHIGICSTILCDEHCCVETSGFHFPKDRHDKVDESEIEDRAMEASFSSAVIHLKYMQQARHKQTSNDKFDDEYIPSIGFRYDDSNNKIPLSYIDDKVESLTIQTHSTSVSEEDNCSTASNISESKEKKSGRKK